MKALQFISDRHIKEAVKFLAAKGSLPYTDASGSPNHRLMGAAWAALHGGYRGNKYAGKDKGAALAKLKAVYKSEKMDTPEESFALGGKFFQEALAQSDSMSAIQSKVMCAVNANIKAGTDMDGDDDGASDAGQCDGCGCVCGQSYGCSCCASCSCKYPQSAWCQDLFPEQVVYSMGGKLMQCDYELDAQGDVQLGDPVEVETSYTPVDAGESEPAESARETSRTLASESVSLQEAAYDASKGTLAVTIIKPGFSKNTTEGRRRFYPAEMLKRDHKIFEGAKMFADHATDRENKDRPEGSIRNWVATMGKTWAESDGTLKGSVTVIDPPFKAKLDRLNEAGLLKEMGVSIRIAGKTSPAEIEGEEAARIDEIVHARSVDFVTYAGAGGQVEAMEATADETDIDVVNEAQLRARRPDLVELIESKSSTEGAKVKTLETQLQESQASQAQLTKENTELKTKFAEAQKATAKATVAAELTKQLKESKLPEISQARISKQFAEAEKVDGIKEAITEELEYVKKLGGNRAPSQKSLGAADNGPTQESEDKKKPNLEEAFKLMPGMSDTDAKVAATNF